MSNNSSSTSNISNREFKISLMEDEYHDLHMGYTVKALEVNAFTTLSNVVQLGSWTPAVYFADPETGKMARKNKNLESIDLMVLDIDEGCTLEEAKDYFKEYKYIIATTRNHQKEKRLKSGATKPACDRFRVILLLERTLTSDLEFKNAWYKIKEEFPFIDPQCNDVARFYYPCSKLVAINKKGKLVAAPVLESTSPDLDDTSEDSSITTQGAVSGGQGATSSSQGGAVSGEAKGGLKGSTYRWLAEGAQYGSRHTAMLDALYDLRENGYSEGEARDRAERVYEFMGEPWSEKQEARIEYVYSKSEMLFERRWPVLIKDKSGKFYPDRNAPENYFYLIKKLGIEAKYNVLMKKEEYKPGIDHALAKLHIEAMRFRLNTNAQTWVSYLKEVAINNEYHPIKSKIENVEGFDEERDYIKELASTIFTKEENKKDTASKLKKWLIGAMAKVYSPQSAQNMVLVFKGEQGVGKSRWLQRLVKEFGNKELFGESHLNFNDKDADLIHLRKFIFHLPELEVATTKKEAGELKAFLTKEKISVREAYARGSTEGYSICSFCASVNNEEFLVDQTGNRRYLIIETESLNADHNINMLHVFKQAYNLWKLGERYWFNKEEIAYISEQNERYMVQDATDEALTGRLELGEDFVSGREILEELNIKEDLRNFMKLKSYLKKAGICQRKRKGIRGYLINRSRLRDKDLGREKGLT